MTEQQTMRFYHAEYGNQDHVVDPAATPAPSFGTLEKPLCVTSPLMRAAQEFVLKSVDCPANGKHLMHSLAVDLDELARLISQDIEAPCTEVVLQDVIWCASEFDTRLFCFKGGNTQKDRKARQELGESVLVELIQDSYRYFVCRPFERSFGYGLAWLEASPSQVIEIVKQQEEMPDAR